MSSQTFVMTVTGTEQVLATLKALGEQAAPAMLKALRTEAEELMTDSQALVPRMDGNLANSGRVVEDLKANVPTLIVGYGGSAAPYALSVHENPRSGQTGGLSPSGKKYTKWAHVGQWKYLEQPWKQRMTGFTDRIAASLRATLLKGG
jgi:hypothetical protein